MTGGSRRHRQGTSRRIAEQPEHVVELDIGPVAHGGACVARDGGRVVFVRHALPGERVRAVVTDTTHDRYWRADAVEVLRASPDRVPAPCPHAGPGRCGGCDWQHASVGAQRRLKAEIVGEQLRRLAGLDWPVEVEAVEEPSDAPGEGLGWRTRMRYALTGQGQVGLRGHRSHEVVPAADCRIAHPLISAAVSRWACPPAAPGAAVAGGAVAGGAVDGGATVGGELDVAVSVSTGTAVVRLVGAAAVPPTIREARPPGASRGPRSFAERWTGGRPDDRRAPIGRPDTAEVVEVVRGRTFRLDPAAFWQVHPGGPEALVDAVLTGLAPRAGETSLDLYSGAGLFAASLAEAVGPDGCVIAMESDPAAVASAARSLADLPWVSVRGVRVSPASLRGLAAARVDTAVLDPPRSGAGVAAMRALLDLGPRAVAYVSCDPASLARDLAVALERGYALVGLRAFDLFPMTAHVECVAILNRR